jgi:hypothetical protein
MGDNVFFSELLEEKTQQWSMSMLLSKGPSHTSSSMQPQSRSLHPSMSPSYEERQDSSPTHDSYNMNMSNWPTTKNQPSSDPPVSHFPVETPTKTKKPTITSIPTAISKPATKTNQPSVNFSPTKSPREASFFPKLTPDPSVIISRNPSTVPVSNPTPSLLQGNRVFDCKLDNVVSVAEPPFSATTSINFKVGYLIESVVNLTEYISALERQILVTALAGALQCETGGTFFTNLTRNSIGRSNGELDITMNTTRSEETCEATISMCNIFETEFQVVINKTMDPDVAGFLGYVLLKGEMDDGTFVEAIPNIDRCQYLKPLPLLPPLVVNDNRTQGGIESTERLSVSPWSLAAVSVMCK